MSPTLERECGNNPSSRPDHADVRKFQPFEAVHGDERDGVALLLLLLLALAVEHEFFEKAVQPFCRRFGQCVVAVQRRDQFLEIAHAVFAGLRRSSRNGASSSM